MRNDGDGRFTLVPLPDEAQLAPVYGILPTDANGDGHTDLLMVGNFDGFSPQIGRMASSFGVALRGDGAGHFTRVPAVESGFLVPGQGRDIARIRARGGRGVPRRPQQRRAAAVPSLGGASPSRRARGSLSSRLSAARTWS